MTQGISGALRSVAGLTPAQRTALTVLARSTTALSAAEVADALGIQRSSARELVEALRDAGLVERERRVAEGRGRPSWAYAAVAPVDPEGPEHTIATTHDAVAKVLRRTHPDPTGAAHEIGRTWADTLLADLIPDHARHDDAAYDRLMLADHMGKIIVFCSMLGFATNGDPDRPTTMQMRACPFRRGAAIDPLICRMHLGMAERIVEVTSRGRTGVTLRPQVEPTLCELELTNYSGA